MEEEKQDLTKRNDRLIRLSHRLSRETLNANGRADDAAVSIAGLTNEDPST